MKMLILLFLILIPIAGYSQRQLDSTVHLDSLTKAEFNRYEDDFGITSQRSAEYFKAHRVKRVDSIAPKSLQTPLSRLAIEEVDVINGCQDRAKDGPERLAAQAPSIETTLSRLEISEVDIVTWETPPEYEIHWLKPLPASEIIKMLPR